LLTQARRCILETCYHKARIWCNGQREQSDYGYEPTSCDVAVRDLTKSAETTTSTRYSRPADFTFMCEFENNQDLCTAERREVIDAMISACPIVAEFAPGSGYSEQSTMHIPSEGPRSLGVLGLNSATAFFHNCSLIRRMLGQLHSHRTAIVGIHTRNGISDGLSFGIGEHVIMSYRPLSFPWNFVIHTTPTGGCDSSRLNGN